MPVDFDPLVDSLPSRYVVGIDLGTTNCAMTYVDAQESPWSVRLFAVPQLVASGQVESRETLPSFHYQPVANELGGDALALPWLRDAPKDRSVTASSPTDAKGHEFPQRVAIGSMARDEGNKNPDRLIASAKSWLCHSGVDRSAPLLPWRGAADVERHSPAEVTASYLRHLRAAWDHRFPQAPLAQQEVVITLPASFDEIARELTVEAAAIAGLPRIVLIEEPQAAFYAWVYQHGENWHQLVHAGDTILVCDIGGGTSDFTLIRVRPTAPSGELDGDSSENVGSPTTDGLRTEPSPSVQFHRVAVGDHLILGGDNLDLALARDAERQLTDGGQLPPHQWDVLVRSCRRTKEDLLGQSAPDQLTIHLPGSGTQLVGGGQQVSLDRDTARQRLIDGFLPRTTLDAPLQKEAAGFREFGLPYASDPAITRHLAAFLTSHRHLVAAGESTDRSVRHDPARPDVVLFNGGFFASPILQARLLEVLGSWFSTPDDQWQGRLLENDRLDLAVARGAAYYGMVRRGEGVRIAATLARSYYLVVEDESQRESGAPQVPSAVCLIPGDAQPGQDFYLKDQSFQLALSRPVEFPLLVSSIRLTDRAGQMVPIDGEQMKPLPPIRTVIRTARKNQQGTAPVQLHAHLSEIGTIELWCHQIDSDRRWRLQFDVRSTTQTDIAAHQSSAESEGFLDEAAWDRAYQALNGVFGEETKGERGNGRPGKLIKQLTACLEMPREDWPTSLLRRIWDALMQLEEGRCRSPAHEARWLNLLGYSLRPGFGLAADDWRVSETWRRIRGRLHHPAATSRTESLILWRRIAGGLSAGHQLALAQPLLSAVRETHRGAMTGKRSRTDPIMAPQESSEVWRLLGTLELLAVPVKLELGQQILDLIGKRKYQKVHSPMIWALGRLGQRVPVSGPLNTVVPSATAAEWLRALMTRDGRRQQQLAVMQIARRTDDRYRDVEPTLRQTVVDWLEETGAAGHLIELVRDGGTLASEEEDQVFGEALPKGLTFGGS